MTITNENVWGSGAMACRVERFHTWPVLRKQSVGEHSCRVMQIYFNLFGLPRAEVCFYVAHHDGGELFAGDNPAPAKWAVPSLKEASKLAESIGLGKLGVTMPDLTEQEFRLVKICDLLELYEYAWIETRMGNLFAAPIMRNVIDALAGMGVVWEPFVLQVMVPLTMEKTT